MYEFTPTVLAIYTLALVVLFIVELFMFWAGCAIANQEPPSWLASFLVVLPVFALSVVLFEMFTRAETILRRWDIRVDVPALLEPYGLGLVPASVIVASLGGWLVALVLYFFTVTKFSIAKGFWVASGEVIFRTVIVLLLASVGLFFGATFQVGTAKQKPEANAVSKQN